MKNLRYLCLLVSLAIFSAGGAIAGDEVVRVKLNTNAGEIMLELNPSKAPGTVENFLNYVKAGHYDGTIFHRVIKGFMIQGGNLDVNMHERETGKPILNESKNGLKNEIYTIAMARESAPDTATDQFYINVANNSFLDYPGRDGWGYCVFGKVIAGADVVEKISHVTTGTKGEYDDVPLEPVIIQSAVIIK
ncbi:MAG: peptidylprolyl isomerase [Bdellovibrionota bacterium]